MLAIQTGLRVSELAALCCQDLQLDGAAWVRCRGKGRKTRCTPLTRQTYEATPARHSDPATRRYNTQTYKTITPSTADSRPHKAAESPVLGVISHNRRNFGEASSVAGVAPAEPGDARRHQRRGAGRQRRERHQGEALHRHLRHVLEG